MKQKGQVIIVLLLIILVSLTVGLAVVQNSLTDISTSTKTDQASKAFSAAEAALEKALLDNTSGSLPTFSNNSSGKVNVVADLPKGSNALEYPPLSKADFAQFWFQNPLGSGGNDYTQTSFMVYFGNCDATLCGVPATDNKPAIEVDTVILSGSNYTVNKQYFDSDSSRVSGINGNNFIDVSPSSLLANKCNSLGSNTVYTNGSSAPSSPSQFYCKALVTLSVGSIPVLARVRLLYTSAPQKIALGPISGFSLPPQASTYTATGYSGESIRQIQVFREQKVVPYFFDFAIFSKSSLTK